MPTRKKRHGGHDEEHESHERWLITYADMLTLLMVLFIVLFAMSQVDKKKFAELAQGLASGFGAKSVTFNAQSSIMDGRGSDSSVLPMMPNVSPQLSNSTGAQTAGEFCERRTQIRLEESRRKPPRFNPRADSSQY